MTEPAWRTGPELAIDLDWLKSIADGSTGSGWEPNANVFEDDIWVLHAIHERGSDDSLGARVHWSDVWARHGLSLGEGMVYPPTFDWIVGPGAHTQATGAFAEEVLHLPDDGTIDLETMTVLEQLLESPGEITAA